MEARNDINLYQTLFFLLLLIGFSVSNAQTVYMMDRDSGVHEFISTHSDANLHFYLFGDGYHSFEKNPTHTYEMHSRTREVKFFTVQRYDDQDVGDDLVGTAGSGAANANRQPIDFKNKIEVLQSWNLVKNKENYMILMFENIENVLPISGCVEWHYNSNELNVIQGEILDDYGNSWVTNRQIQTSEYSNEGYTNKIVWDFANLAYEEQRFIYIPVNCLEDEMQKVITRGVMKTGTCSPLTYNPNNDGKDDHISSSPFYTLVNVVRGYPHDPNCISTDPYALTLLDEQQTVIYRIYFQNEGTAPAQNVLLDFVIYAPVFNLSYLASSDNCVVNQVSPQRWDILFEDIFLPGTRQQPAIPYEQTYGWVDFEVCYDLGQFIQHFADSNVDIYFDWQPAISAQNRIYRILDQSMQSNCAINSILSLQGQNPNTATTIDSHELEINPIPSNYEVTLTPPLGVETYSIEIMDIAGAKISSLTGLVGSYNLNISDYRSGMYFAKISHGNEFYVKRFIRQ